MEAKQHVHEGRNIKRFREMLGIKQETLAYELGESWTQKKVSQLEAKDKVEDAILEQVAKILKVPQEAIRNFDEETAIYNIQNNYEGSSSNFNGVYKCTFNPIDRLAEAHEEIKKLHAEKEALYERLLKALEGK